MLSEASWLLLVSKSQNCAAVKAKIHHLGSVPKQQSVFHHHLSVFHHHLSLCSAFDTCPCHHHQLSCSPCPCLGGLCTLNLPLWLSVPVAILRPSSLTPSSGLVTFSMGAGDFDMDECPSQHQDIPPFAAAAAPLPQETHSLDKSAGLALPSIFSN